MLHHLCAATKTQTLLSSKCKRVCYAMHWHIMGWYLSSFNLLRHLKVTSSQEPCSKQSHEDKQAIRIRDYPL